METSDLLLEIILGRNSKGGYDPSLVRKANTRFALGGPMDPDAESISSIKLFARRY
jgi:hypothetical protein